MTKGVVQKLRVKRTRPDLIAELGDQTRLLVHACKSFDGGLQPIGKHIALSLRVLLHQHGQSQALLQQLQLRSKRFLDTAGKLNPHNLLSDCHLCVMRMGGGQARYLPLCIQGGSPHGEHWVPFEQWWNTAVVKDNKGRRFNRRDLVLNVANTDGGAHVDPTLDAAYSDLSRNNSLGWMIVDGDVQRPFPPPTMACLRQIAHEVLRTLQAKAQNEVKVDYAV